MTLSHSSWFRAHRVELLVLLVIWAACVYEVISAYLAHPLSSTDGAFQTYSMTRSFAEGETVGRDVFPYLGVLPIALILPFYLILGQTLWASSASSIIVVQGLFILIVWTYARLAGLRPAQRVAVVIALSIGIRLLAKVYGVLFATGHGAAPLELITPGTSLRAIRWALPALSGLVMYYTLRGSDHLAERATQLTRVAVVWGMLAGVCLLWSNDLGPITAASIVFVWTVLALRWMSPGRAATGALVLVTAAAVTGAVSLLLVTGANARAWLSYNYVGVAGDQFWYFGPHAEQYRIFGIRGLVTALGPLPHSLLAVALVIALAWIGWRLLRATDAFASDAVLFHMGAISLAGAFVPQIGGHIEAGYTGILIIPAAMLSFYGLVHWRRKRRAARSTYAYITARTSTRRSLIATVVVLLGYHLFFARPLIVRLRQGFAAGTRYVPALGARVREHEARDLAQFAAFGKVADAAGLDSSGRMMFEYQSALNIVSGARSPSPFDAVIHALGDEGRATHLAAYAGRTFPVATSINPYSPELWERQWARWNLRASWYWYRVLHERYEPYARTPQHLIWRPRAQPRATVTPLACEVRRDSPSRVTLVFGTEDGLQTTAVNLVEIRATLGMKVRASGLPVLGKRGLIHIIEPFSPHRTDDPGPATRDVDYGYPPAGQMPLVAEHAAGHTGMLIVEALPAARAEIVVDACEARTLGPSPHWKADSLPPLQAPPNIAIGRTPE